MDGYLKSNLDVLKTEIKKDWDFLMVVDGREGAGKSSLAAQIGYYLDPTLNLSRFCFNAKQFQEAVYKAEKYQCIILDEGYGALSSRAAMSWVNRTLVKMLTEIRMKNLFILVLLPSFYDLDKYVAMFRSCALIHVRTKEGSLERGDFNFYSYKKKMWMYSNCRKDYSYNHPDFWGSFSAFFPFNKDEYIKAKLEGTKQTEAVYERFQWVKGQRNTLILELVNTFGMTRTDVAILLEKAGYSISREQIGEIVSGKPAEPYRHG